MLLGDGLVTELVGIVAAVAASASVLFALYVQRDVIRDRRCRDPAAERDRRQRYLEAAMQQAVVVYWAAKHPAHEWDQPLRAFAVTIAALADSKLEHSDRLAHHPPPTTEGPTQQKYDDEANDVAQGALDAQRELFTALAAALTDEEETSSPGQLPP